MKYGDIVKYNNKLGKLVTDDNKNFLFHPAKFGSYYYNQLDIVTENDITETTFEEKIAYIEQEFGWGTVIKTHCISEYQIIEYIDRDSTKSYHPYINFKDTSSYYNTIDQALIGVIAQNHIEINSANHATGFIYKMLNMKD